MGVELRNFLIVAAMTLVLAGCESDEERSDRHFESAVEYMQDGDEQRAIVELRNALAADKFNMDARKMMADILFSGNRLGGALREYGLLVEQDPESVLVNARLAELNLEAGRLEQARDFAEAALELDETDLTARMVLCDLEFREGVRLRDEDRMQAAADQAREILAEDPDRVRARRILTTHLVHLGRLDAALEMVEAGLEAHPEDRDLNNLKLITLIQMDDDAAIEGQIRHLIELFPEDEEAQRLLVQFYLRNGQIDSAEEWLRSRVDPGSEDMEPRMTLLRFLSDLRSTETMRDEVAQILDQDPLPADVAANEDEFRALKAGAEFLLGNRGQAISEMEEILHEREPSTALDRLKVQLARMYDTTGNSVGARALIEEVLEHDQGQVEATKLKANWLIQDDRTQDAIQVLRVALNDAPNDPQLMTLMAQAYQREGKTDLMGDMLARAVEASRQAPQEAMTYATYLTRSREYRLAEDVLINALRREPNNLDVLIMLTNTHLAMEDWARAEQDISTIRARFETERSRLLADDLQARLLTMRQQGEELSAFLDEMARESGNELAASLSVIRNALRAGRLDDARDRAEKLAETHPDNPQALFARASVETAAGNNAEAIGLLEALVADAPGFERAWQVLMSLQQRENGDARALETVEEALTHLPQSRRLRFARAGLLERDNRIDEALEIYEALYAENSSDVAVANNLASLLANTRADDQESLDRAYVIARRLNGIELPPLQDTYGWILFLRGDVQGALEPLRAAAEGLPEDPAVLYHLGRVYAALQRRDQAAEQFDRATALVNSGDVPVYPGLPEALEEARAALSE